ncbi:ribosome maturation factor RimM [Domibacillus indicus]|jgi:16S rRNA processing protein RimM|uniref:ribosome maturation factor RimM n=1 Tax=Domibacillus indicus TaxID=1437523 RepID=UPI00203F81D2|nr:ribosome maturation factor RimM [Domibacillus indicus]MCM3787595.1 ribosome maturation factor RimM [Domibacillus indicus]
MSKWFNVGKIVNTHGLRGEVRVMSQTDFPEKRFKKGSELAVFKKGDKEGIPVTVAAHRTHKNFDLLTFEGRPSIEDVEAFKGTILKVHETHLGELDEGEFYLHEIVGCQVETMSGDTVGKVTEVLTPGANDVWVVKGEDKTFYIPYIDDVVKSIDKEKKLILIDPMEGLLE